VIVPAQRIDRIPAYVLALQRGFEAMGHRADIINAWTEDGYRLPAYEYIAVAVEPISFLSRKLPSALSKILSEGSGLSGKKSAAFLGKKCLFANKTLSAIMSTMEKEGMVINWSEIIFSPEQAEVLAKRIGT
jgi:hypothetical protein